MSHARIYIRVSTQQQDLERQEAIIEDAKAKGFTSYTVYREKASGARADRPELQRMISDLQTGDVVIAEQMDRITRLPLDDAKQLIQTIKDKGARLAIPNVVDLSDLINTSEGVARVVLEAVQDMLLNLALQMAHEDYQSRRKRQKQGIAIAKREGKYTGKTADKKLHAQIIELRSNGTSISKTADLCGCSKATVTNVWKKHNANK